MVDPRASDWSEYQDDMLQLAEALDVEMSTPRFIPWTRKAHELGVHARERDCYATVRDALFRAHFVERRDIGRIDVLVDVAERAGLDRTETKAVLDVDRHTAQVASDRALAQELGVAGVPTLVRGSARLEGVRSAGDIMTWLDAG
jgi:predicted DsbA family dithiol-disulfide isomerase